MVNMDEMKKFVGNKGKPTVFEIDKTMIKRYCEAIGDPSPVWRDRMPPGMLTAAMLMGEGAQMPPFPYPGIVDAGGDWEYFKSIKAGDTITVVNEFTGTEDKSNDKRKMLLFHMKSTFTNQHKEVVAVASGRVMNLG
jgi:acyl dehydratase